ncbi:MAG: peptidyl-prolyl cis-trans isomerase [Verrucomicrobiota bacterium]
MKYFSPQTLGIATAAGLVLLAASCSKRPPANDPEIVAQVGGTAITRAQLLQAWERRGRGTTNIQAATVLIDLVDEAAGYAQAQRSGFLDKPETQVALRHWVASRYREEAYHELITSPEPADREVRAAYAEHTNSFVRPAALNLAVILHEVPRTATAEKREEARQIVAGWRAEILASTNVGRSFGRAASAHSDDSSTRYRRGESGWLSHAELGARLAPEVVAAAARQETGSLSEPLAGPKGFYLVQVLGRRDAEVRPFVEVEPTLRHQLRESRRLTSETQLRVALRSGVDIRTNLDVMNTLTLTNRPTTPPPGMPKG